MQTKTEENDVQTKTLLTLKIITPTGIFAEIENVVSIVAETTEGSLGILPHRLDCAAALAPGIFSYQQSGKSHIYMAVDQGALVKTGLNVNVSVRNAIVGKDLAQLHEAIEKVYLNLSEEEKQARAVMQNLESNFLSRMARYHDE
ncbi:MAG: F0F1 ATP synthase subunit epsilon [Cyanobacteria bacterium REEB67]|nr:F0F1 ATP synthase subunit epsilon [Cyanobacteria bacterium REEB67]